MSSVPSKQEEDGDSINTTYCPQFEPCSSSKPKPNNSSSCTPDGFWDPFFPATLGVHRDTLVDNRFLGMKD